MAKHILVKVIWCAGLREERGRDRVNGYKTITQVTSRPLCEDGWRSSHVVSSAVPAAAGLHSLCGIKLLSAPMYTSSDRSLMPHSRYIHTFTVHHSLMYHHRWLCR